MNLGINHLTDRAGRQLDQLLVRLTPRQLTEQINGFEQAVSALGSTLSRAIAEALKGRQLLFAGRIRVLDALSYTAVLKRGFALVRSGGVAVTSASAVAPESDLEIEFQDGRIAATVGGLPSTSAAKPTPTKPAGRKPPSGKDRRGQGELF